MWKYMCLLLFSCHGLADENVDPSQKDMITEQKEQASIRDLKTDGDFKDFINQMGVNCVYFFKTGKTSGGNSQKRFLKDLAKSTRLMAAYGVHVGLVDCEKDDTNKKYCSKEKVQNYVYAFKNGHELLKLNLNTMFDVDSIVSNILQIVLLRELPIIQSLDERIETENKAKGERDIIFSFQRAIGTYEHRILGEITFAYQSKYKFGVTTESPVVDDLDGYSEKDDAAVWILRCSILEAGSPDRCPVIKFRGNMDLASLARFVRVMEIPLIHTTETDGDYNPYPDNDLHTVIIFYDGESYDGVMEEAKSIITRFFGLLGVLMINVEVPTLTKFGLPQNLRIPALGVKLIDAENFHFMPYEHTSPVVFVNQVLMGTIKTLPELTEDGEDIEREKATQISADYEMLQEVEREDDPVAIAAMKLRRKQLDKQHIQVLTDKTFSVVTKDSHLVVVLFYVTFDARSTVFLHAYTKAAELLSGLPHKYLATVDCFDWTDVCAKYNITRYPSIRIYRKDKAPIEYTGMLSTSAMVSTVHLYLADSPVMLGSPIAVEEFIQGNLPENIGKYTQFYVMGLYKFGQTQEIETYKSVAKALQGKAVFGLAIGDSVIAKDFRAKPNSIILYKTNDNIEPFAVMREGLTNVDAIIKFITTSSVPVFPEITTSSFPTLIRRKLPFAILFEDSSNSDIHTAVGSLAKKEEFKNKIIICWMNVPDEESVGHQVLMSYKNSASVPALTVVNHETSYIYNYDSEDFSGSTVEKWLTGVMKGDVSASTVLNQEDWKPKNPGYDFLKMMDEAQQKANGEEMEEDHPHVHPPDMDVSGMTDDEGPHDMEDGEYVPQDKEDSEDEIRSELLGLHSSRLYHSADKHKADIPPSEASAPSSEYSHTEL